MKLKLIYAGLMTLLLVACASIGAPDGGIFDEIPPKVVGTTPVDRSTNNSVRKMQIRFDEYVKLENANEKVIVSPPQIEPANIRAVGKTVRVTLYDSLQANTTYTIDFSDAITDNNEGNPMGHYTYSFSTGNTIDTMEVSGTVLNAQDLEPIKGMLVGLYPLDSLYDDSLFRTKPLSRVSRTNGSGKFCIKGVKPGQYRAFALEDKDGNFIYSQKSERVAFLEDTFSVSCKPDERMDTIWSDYAHTRYDTIMTVGYTHFYPDNLVLNAFLTEGQEQHLLKEERPNPDYMTLYFTAPMDSLPVIRGLNFDEKMLAVDASLHNDTITYWFTDTTFTHHQDTAHFELTFLETDSLGQLQPSTMEREVIPKQTWDKIWKEQQAQIKDWQKQREKQQKRSKEPLKPQENPYEKTYLDFSAKASGSIDPNKNVHYISKEPIAQVDTTRMHLYYKKDTDWLPEPFLFLPDRDVKAYTLYAEWEENRQYRFNIDSAAVVSVMGHVNKPVKTEFNVKGEDVYGSLFVHILLPDTASVYVQLCTKAGKQQAELKADKDGRADFFYITPGAYYLRCFVDRNGNGIWDTGDYDARLQPEAVYYFPQPIQVKAKWDIEQDWSPLDIERTQQKPLEITKQKPDKQKSVKNRNEQREREKQERRNNRG